ncbi:hypothetical protein BN2537_329 [Streptomyces venezuelae]|nr:hypothetical protein BN2537_329 [Streptomyces venezuelae]
MNPRSARSAALRSRRARQYDAPQQAFAELANLAPEQPVAEIMPPPPGRRRGRCGDLSHVPRSGGAQRLWTGLSA